MTEDTPSRLGNVVTIDDERIKSHLDRVVRGSVEETLNALLDAEADRLCNAERYERSEARRDRRAGHYERKLRPRLARSYRRHRAGWHRNRSLATLPRNSAMSLTAWVTALPGRGQGTLFRDGLREAAKQLSA